MDNPQIEYEEFLTEYFGDAMDQMILDDSIKRLLVNIDVLRDTNKKRATSLFDNAIDEQAAFVNALKNCIHYKSPSYVRLLHGEFLIGFYGSFGANLITPRRVNVEFLGRLISVHGVVCESSDVKIRLIESAHFCHTTKKYHTKKHPSFTSFKREYPFYNNCPTRDEDGNVLELDEGESVYMNYQTIMIRDLPQDSATSTNAGRVDVILTNDLVNTCRVGDFVQVFGDYRDLPHTWDPKTGLISTAIVANHIIVDRESLDLSQKDKDECKRLSQRPDILELLVRSIAPSICGHDTIKKALVCLLVGGVPKKLQGGIRLRGDINILLVGDPSCGKSQLIRCVMSVAERAISTVGLGTSNVGLTASIGTDPNTNEPCLQAGAMVLGDQGVVCIDEFDKMSDTDRTALHQTMEQQQVTVCKAGINATINARCSVLAAANPIGGRYDFSKTPLQNINMQDSLLSRFDLVFFVRDTIDMTLDKKIAKHVGLMHCSRNPNEADGEVLSDDISIGIGKTEKEQKTFTTSDGGVLTKTFLKKYIQHVKCLKPILSNEANELITEEYARLRETIVTVGGITRSQPITPRLIEALIRVSTAHAKIRMSEVVEAIDAKNTIDLIEYAYFGYNQLLTPIENTQQNVTN